MDLQRIWILLRKEIRQNMTGVMFIMAVVMPIALSLLLGLVFGDLFAQKPRLGIYDEDGNSQITTILTNHAGMDTRLYASENDLTAAVERGTVEIGLLFPTGFDAGIQGGQFVNFTTYRWGEASVNNLLLLETAIGRAIVESTGLNLPVQVNIQQLGTANTTSWSQRLLPLLIIMSVLLGGLAIPASSLIEEKQKRTLIALTATPTTLLDVYLAKMGLGFIVSTLMGILILILNNAFGAQPALLLLIIAMGALFGTVIGIILGSFSKDMDTFMGIIKVLGIILYAPALLEIFPQIPSWIGQLFPTYYILNPLLAVSQRGAGLADIAGELAILAGMMALLLFALSRVIGWQQQQLALSS